jgi:hypothetical protein
MRLRRKSVAGALAALAMAGTAAAPARAQTSGPETIRGMVVVSGASGTRQVAGSTIIAQGAYTGAGRVADSQGGGDQLVFPDGTLQLASSTELISSSVNPMTCVFNAVYRQTSTVTGGTGRLAGATGDVSGTVSAWGLLSRNADGGCARDQPPLHEIESLTLSGQLTY